MQHSEHLVTQAEVPVNWCPALGTVLANEEVVDGVSERGGHPVVKKVRCSFCYLIILQYFYPLRFATYLIFISCMVL